MTTLTSNWRPLLRAFYPFLIAIAALWAMPKNARAQLYVTEVPGDNGGVVDNMTPKPEPRLAPASSQGWAFPWDSRCWAINSSWWTSPAAQSANTTPPRERRSMLTLSRACNFPPDLPSRAQDSAPEITEKNFPNLAPVLHLRAISCNALVACRAAVFLRQ
jgi:hypothetical protein